MKKWDEKLADLSEKLARLSSKTADASEEAKAARELKEEAIRDRISTVKGNVIAFQEKARISGEERKGKFRSAILKAQMTVEERTRQRREKRDKKQFEEYIDDRISYIYENFETASYLISNAQLAILETVEAIDEYEAKYGSADTEPAEEGAEASEEEAAAEGEEVTEETPASEDEEAPEEAPAAEET